MLGVVHEQARISFDLAARRAGEALGLCRRRRLPRKSPMPRVAFGLAELVSSVRYSIMRRPTRLIAFAFESYT